ncbi:aldolase/citrate lyase family protein [Pseudoalteromonas sp. H105]|uniref:aldolase/citrate lyase family protein n=1 Tax=Pseudoalteromonas sp. H105 TaxID=1348393 RepID=UPI0007324007|nr:aldolase/citrate lyase family protein [Pseudoalteromonas sp. H105]KTF15326.1 hypothetical protein ATS75_10500 [Pseudoalteromonas sp. H105]
MDLMLITNSPVYAKYAEKSGVDIIFIDLEIDGKIERQGHLDTVISSHDIKDVSRIKKVLKKAKILVRVNPYNEFKTEQEVEDAIRFGADMIMLPMFTTVDEVIAVHKLINNRCTFVPLLETVSAVESLDKILEANILTDLHIGLNDLHLDYKLRHMFELFTNGTIDTLVSKLKLKGINYGIGGVASMNGGDIEGETVLNKYLSMGSNRVILSRSFHRSYSEELHAEIDRLRLVEGSHKVENSSQYDKEFKASLVKI